MIAATHELAIEIGEMPIVVRTDSPEFAHMLEDRYGEFVAAEALHAVMELEIELVKEPGLEGRDSGFGKDDDEDVRVRLVSGRWVMERGDFRAEWDPQRHRGWVRQRLSPYAIDGVLRILHSLILAREGGFLVHAASAVRNGRAFVFAGVSGAGKTTLARLAPPDVTLLSDEISYVRPRNGSQESGVRSQGLEVRSEESEIGRQETGDRSWENRKSQTANRKSQIDNRQSAIENFPSPEPRIENPKSKIQNRSLLNRPSTIDHRQSFDAFGTPFAGELARVGQKVRAPLASLFVLKQGPENRIEPLSESQAARELLRHVLFFARDEELVGMIFQTVCDFVSRVPVRRLVFTPDARVWELIA